MLVQVPDFKTFDPIEAGLVPASIDKESPEFFAAYQHLVYDYFMEQSAEVLELPKKDLMKVQMVYGPKLFSLIERMGSDAQVAGNCVVAGDSFGNGHFLTSGGAMTGMVGHSMRVLTYWHARDGGASAGDSIRALAEGIREDTLGWLRVSAQEYSEAVPINFGAERIKKIAAGSGIAASARAHSIDSTRRKRHSLLPLDPSDWRRLFLRNGRVLSAPLPELHAMHPALRAQRSAKKGTKRTVAFVARSLMPGIVRFVQALAGQPGVRLGLITCDPPEMLPRNLRERLAAHALVAEPIDPERIGEAVRSMSCDLGLPEMLLATCEDLQLPLAEVRSTLGIGGMGADIAANFRDKPRMKALLGAAGLPVAKHSLVETCSQAADFARRVGYPLVVKPPGGTSARSTLRVEGEDQLRGALERLGAEPGRPVLCEEFVAGRECSLEVMTIGGVPAWWSATRCDPAPLHVLENPWIQWTVTLPRELEDPADVDVRRMGFSALRALGIGSGISHMEWFRRADGTVAISEIAARPPSSPIVSLMGQAHGADVYRAWANAVVHGLFAPIPRQHAAGAAFLRAQGCGDRVRAVVGLEEIQRELGALITEVQAPRIGQARSGSHEGEGVVLVRHAETKVVDEALRRVIERVRVEV